MELVRWHSGQKLGLLTWQLTANVPEKAEGYQPNGWAPVPN